MTLRGKKRDSRAKPMVTFRCPPDLRRYVDETSKATERDKTEIITDAIALDRDIGLKLAAEQPQLQAFAKAQGLDIDDDLPEILSRLVRLGLTAIKPGK